jgi:hypothetical protein
MIEMRRWVDAVDLAHQVDDHVDADHLDDEEDPFGRPLPDEAVNQRRDPARTRHRGRVPDARPGDRAQHVAENQQEQAVFLDEVEQFRLVAAVRHRRQVGEEQCRADRRVREQHMDRGDQADDPAAADAGLVPHGIKADVFHPGSV